MKYFSVVNNNGQIIANINCDESTFIDNANLYPDHLIVEGWINPDTFYLKNGIAVAYPEKPLYECNFDYNTEMWIIDLEIESEIVRKRRNNYLLETDWVDNALTRIGQEKYNLWQEYRQALRDLPQQSDFPLSIVWPSKPE